MRSVQSARNLLALTACACISSPALAQDRQELQVPTYQLQTGDTLDVKYRTTPEYDQTVTILPDGDVSLTLLGNVHLSGLTVQQAHDAVTLLAAKRLRDPDVSLSVKEGEKDHFSVVGEVTTPGRFELHGRLTAVEALAMAGGFKNTSSQNNVVLVHRLSETSEYGEATAIDFRRLRKLNASTELPTMHPGDVLIVSTNKFSKLERVVRLSSIGLYYPLP